jgi:hypothetical protein
MQHQKRQNTWGCWENGKWCNEKTVYRNVVQSRGLVRAKIYFQL